MPSLLSSHDRVYSRQFYSERGTQSDCDYGSLFGGSDGGGGDWKEDRTVNNLLSHLKLTYRTRLSSTIRDGLA